ncbi:MAG: GNAT family N-acetyltransferase [Phycisphaerae bacterium]|nr:GNAT family N-acetyltransferase [Phycisphaerae bacterium]
MGATEPSPPITILPAIETDAPEIARIVNWAVAHSAANFSYDPEPAADYAAQWRETHAMYPWYVAIADSADSRAASPRPLIGYCRASKWKTRAAYAWTCETSIYIDPAYHGRGVGRALYQRLIRTLAAQGYRRLIGGVTVPNPASERLHESLGFVRVAHYPQLGWKFGRWHDVAYFELSLGDDAPPGEIRPVAMVEA